MALHGGCRNSRPSATAAVRDEAPSFFSVLLRLHGLCSKCGSSLSSSSGKLHVAA